MRFMSDPQFVFLVCQVDTENLIKRRLATRLPEARFAFSRPGLMTYKVPDLGPATIAALTENPWIRTFGRSHGPVNGDLAELATWLTQHPALANCRHWHLWRRDRARVGEFGFEPFHDPERDTEAQSIAQQVTETLGSTAPRINSVADAGATVLDLIAVDPNRWLVGSHVANSPPSNWPGGVPPLVRKEVVSRAYYKLEEAIRWAQLPIASGQLALELGSAPGGACQALLERGLTVIGVDPAEMDPRVAQHPEFTHWRMRTNELRKRQLAEVNWLICDANLTAERTIADVETIATSPHVSLRGAILTLKMPEWRSFEHFDELIARITSWGWRQVRARHRAFDRQELVVVAEK